MPADKEQKALRQDAIRQLLGRESIPSQTALATRLEELGIPVTQSCISRDLTELDIAKRRGFYCMPEITLDQDSALEEIAVLLRGVANGGTNMLVLHTAIGGASRVAHAIDRANMAEIVGTIAGDDTIFCAVSSTGGMRKLEHQFKQLISESPS